MSEKDWFDEKMADPEFRKGFFVEQAKMHQEDIADAVAAETKRCAGALCPGCKSGIVLDGITHINPTPMIGANFLCRAAAIRAAK